MKSPANLSTSDPRPRVTRRRLMGALIAGVLLLVAVVFFFFDPTRHAFYPSCLFYKLTGLNCPGCGGLRALHQLTHGDIVAAFRCNPLLITLLPFIAFLSLRWFKHGRSAFDGNPGIFRPATIWTLLAVTLVFTILRNLPGPAFAWMSP